jgi:hypothetical protein
LGVTSTMATQKKQQRGEEKWMKLTLWKSTKLANLSKKRDTSHPTKNETGDIVDCKDQADIKR